MMHFALPSRLRTRLSILASLASTLGLAQVPVSAEAPDWRSLAAPVVEGPWVRPAAGGPARPVWGHADGLRIGLAPMPGPRGLLRVYAPYLGHREGRVVNFIAVEPIPTGQSHRGLSELEPSRLDPARGKRFWSADTPDDPTPADAGEAAAPARGKIVQEDGVETLQVYILVERFDNGAHVYLRLTFRADRPHEVGIATFAHPDSAPLDHCIVTATMGNYARLRQLHLADRTVYAGDLWPRYQGDAFAPHAKFSLSELVRTPEGGAMASATPDEPRPQEAEYAPGTAAHWRYTGDVATQSWRSETPDPDLQVWVNGRFTYWGSRAPIPGGISYENFEMVAPFHQGNEFWFRIEPGRPDDPDQAEQEQP